VDVLLVFVITWAVSCSCSGGGVMCWGMVGFLFFRSGFCTKLKMGLYVCVCHSFVGYLC
jgi:hypothetical protein